MTDPSQPYAIVNLREGAERDVEPFLLNNDAFPNLENMYLFRGRIERKSAYMNVGKFGRLTKFFSETSPTAGLPNVPAGAGPYAGTLANLQLVAGSLQISIATAPPTVLKDKGDGTILQIAPTFPITGITQANPGEVTSVGHGLANGDVIFISGVTGMTEVNDQYFTITVTGVNTFTIGIDTTGFNPYGGGGIFQYRCGTINYLTSVFTVNFKPSLAGPGPYTLTATYSTANCQPCMGLRVKEKTFINDEALYGFDPQFSYIFAQGTSQFQENTRYKVTGIPFTWTGTNSDFFWTTNWRNAMWTTNNIPGFKWVQVTIPIAANAVIPLAGHPFVVGDKVYFTIFSPVPPPAFFITPVPPETRRSPVFNVTAIVAGVSFTIDNPAPPVMITTAFVMIPTTTLAGMTGDGIRWTDEASPNNPTDGWVNFNPPLSSSFSQNSYLEGAKLIVAYKDRLLAFNTFESTQTTTGGPLIAPVNFPQRVRWSQNGTPFYASPIPTNQGQTFDAWYSDPNSIGRGGFLDAPTNEQIVSAAFIKDTLIVYFERSTWQIVYTGNEILPFIFQKINTELGCESTFSTIQFDQGVLAVGNIGITSCNSVNVERIDQKIPDEVFNFNNLFSGVQRIHGIRDFGWQFVYWNFLQAGDTREFPNQVLFFNYMDQSWAFFDDSWTCFGYFQNDNDLTWAEATFPWNTANFAWSANASFAKYPIVIAGNQQGFVMQISQSLQVGLNDPVLCIDAVAVAATTTVTSPNHNLIPGQYVQLMNLTGMTPSTSAIFPVISNDTNTFQIDTTFAGPYLGGGLVRIVPNFNITTKLYNPFYQEGKGVRMSRLEILADYTCEGQIHFDYFDGFAYTTPIKSQQMNTSPDNPVPAPVDPIFENQEYILWHRLFPNMSGSFIQIQIALNDLQIRNQTITSSDVTIQGMVMYLQPTGRLI